MTAYDASAALSAYYPARSERRPARLWAVEKLVLDMEAAGLISVFKGAGNDPTVLTGYSTSKLWLQVGTDVTTDVGTVRVYDGSGTVTDIASWPALTGDGLRRHLGALTTTDIAGLYAIPFDASGMVPRSTNGAVLTTSELSTNKIMRVTYDFDASTQQYAQFAFRMPKSWNEGTITASFTWSHPSTTTNFGVVWGIQAVAVGNGDANDAAFGTAQTVTDTGGTTDTIYFSDKTSAVTIAGTPAAEDLVIFQVYRAASNVADTLAVSARLHAVSIYITTDAITDA